MQSATVVGKSLRHPLLLFQRELGTVSLKHRGEEKARQEGINREGSLKKKEEQSIKEGKSDIVGGRGKHKSRVT